MNSESIKKLILVFEYVMMSLNQRSARASDVVMLKDCFSNPSGL